MIKFFFAKDSGEVVMSGTCLESELPIQRYNGFKGIPGHAEPGKHYYRDGEVMEIPPSPGEDYVFDFTAAEWRYSEELAWASLRNKRDLELAESDWTGTADAPLSEESKSKWKEYRQQLRDITLVSHPKSAVWPEKPSS